MESSDEVDLPVYHLQNAPIENGKLNDWRSKGRTVAFKLHPFLRKGLAYINNKEFDENTLKSDNFEEVESLVYEFSTPSTLIEPNYLLTAWHELWEELQDTYMTPILDSEANLLLLTQFYGKISSLFRSKIIQVLEELQSRINEGEKDCQPVLDSLWEVESAWRCAEAIYFPPSSPYTLSTGILDWVNAYDPQPIADDGLEIMAYRIPYQHPGFWPYVNKTAIRGLFEQTISCLEMSGLTKEWPVLKETVDELIDILRYSPCMHQKRIRSVSDFERRWKLWRSRLANLRHVVKKHRDIDSEVLDDFVVLLDILNGNKEVIMLSCAHWQEYFSALAFLYDPLDCKNPEDISLLYQLATGEDSKFYVNGTIEYEQICVNLCSNEPLNAIKHAYLLDLGLAVHLADLLSKSGHLRDYITEEYPITLREHLILEYGQCVLESRNLWQTSFAYWKCVADSGYQRIKACIPYVPLSDMDAKETALQLCKQLKLRDEAQLVLTHWADELIARNHYGEALIALDNAANYSALNRVTWELFDICIAEKKSFSPDKDELLYELFSSPKACTPTLASIISPAATIHQYFFYLQHKKELNASELLVGLLTMVDFPSSRFPKLLELLHEFLNNPLQSNSTDFKLSLVNVYDCIAVLQDQQSTVKDQQLLLSIHERLSSAISWHFLHLKK